MHGIPIVCKYFIVVVSMEMREKNQSHVAVRYLRQNGHTIYSEMLEVMNKINANLITIVQNYYTLG
jgi:hypothetical protein